MHAGISILHMQTIMADLSEEWTFFLYLTPAELDNVLYSKSSFTNCMWHAPGAFNLAWLLSNIAIGDCPVIKSRHNQTARSMSMHTHKLALINILL